MKYFIIVVIIALGGIAAYMMLGSLGDDQEQETANTDPYVVATTTDAYEIDISVTRTGIEELDAEMITYLQTLEAQLLEMASGTDPEVMVAPYSLTATSEVHSDSRSGLKTILVSVYQYTGGAHGMPLFAAWTYSEEYKETYELGNILSNEEETLEYLYGQVQDIELIEGSGEEWIRDGSGLVWENYTLFRVQEGGLVFMFPPYQVAPYAAGVIELPQSWKELAPYLRGGIADNIGVDNTPPSEEGATTTASSSE